MQDENIAVNTKITAKHRIVFLIICIIYSFKIVKKELWNKSEGKKNKSESGFI